MPTRLERLRSQMPAVATHRLFNFAATAPMAAPTAEVMAEFARQGAEPLSEHRLAWLEAIESTRAAVAAVIGAPVDQVAFVTNTSTALSLVAAAVRWRPGDRVLYPADEFPSNRYVWENLAERGVEPEAIELAPDRTLLEALQVRDWNRVRLVALSAVSYHDGRVHEVAEVVRLCHQHGALVAVDAIQAVGMRPVDVAAWRCDFLCCGGQKWLLGPVGSGFVYVAPAVVEQLWSPLVGWASVEDAGDFEAPMRLCRGARRWEPGLPDVAAIAALGKSVELLGEVGWAEIRGRIEALGQTTRAMAADLGLQLDQPAPRVAGGIVSMRLPQGLSTDEVTSALRKRRIVATVRNNRLRLSPHAVTRDEDVDALRTCLRSLVSETSIPARTPAVRNVPQSPGPVKDTDRAGDQRWRHALVTGASRGLGAALAESLARRGCDVTLIGRDEKALGIQAERIGERFGVAAEPICLDLSDLDRVGRWLDESNRSLDVLVNNAAMAEAGSFDSFDERQLRDGLMVNAGAPMLLTSRLVPAMRSRGFGAVLNVVATNGRCALPCFGAYAAGKAGLWAWSEALAREVAGSGVTVTTFLPEHMDTATLRRLGRFTAGGYGVAGGGHVAEATAEAERAIEAMLRGRRVDASLSSRVRIAMNALWPGLIDRQVKRRWHGGRHESNG